MSLKWLIEGRRQRQLPVDSVPAAETFRSACGGAEKSRQFGWRFFMYIAHGGVKALGRSARQNEREVRQTRFLMVASGLGVIWLVLLVW